MKSFWKWLKNPQLERNNGLESGTPCILDNKLHASRDVIRTFVLLPKAAWTYTFSPPPLFSFLFISDELAIVFVLLASATSVSIAREITFLPDNKLMSREESCNWCSRRDEIDVDLSNKEYLAPRRKEKSGREKERERERENLSTFRRGIARCVLLLLRINWFQLYPGNYRASLDAPRLLSLKRSNYDKRYAITPHLFDSSRLNPKHRK